MYFTINMDVKTSRKHTNRDVLQKNLADLCQQLNKTPVVSKFDIILGDEVQGLIHYEALPEIIMQLIAFERQYHFNIYMGVGYGNISTVINYEDVEKNDGPCFHQARSAINQAKKNGLPNLIIGNPSLESVQDLLNLYWKFYKDLSDRAFDIFSLIKQDKTQTEIAITLNAKQSSISKTISRYNIIELIKLEKNFSMQLQLLKEAQWL